MRCTPIRDGRNEDSGIDGQGLFHLCLHFERSFHINAQDARRCRQMHGAGNERDLCAKVCCGGSDGKALTPRRAVGDVAHRVNRLMRWTGGDEDVFAGQGTKRPLRRERSAARDGSW